MAQWWLWATCVTTTSRFTASNILVVITTVKEWRVVAILLLHSNATSTDILIRQGGGITLRLEAPAAMPGHVTLTLTLPYWHPGPALGPCMWHSQ